MKALWIRALLPVLVMSMVVACGKKDDGGGKAKAAPRYQTPTQSPRQEPAQTREQTETVDPRLQPQQTEPGAPDIPGEEEGQTTTPPRTQNGPGLPGGGEPAPIPEAPAPTTPAVPPRNQNKPPERGTPPAQGNEGNPAGSSLPGSEPQIPRSEPQIPANSDLTSKEIATAYTGAGDDYLRDYLTQKMKSVENADVRRRNQTAAENVRGVRTRIDRETGDVLVSVVREVRGQIQTSLLGGILNAAGVTPLKAQGDSNVKGSLVCLDLNVRTCYVAAIRLEIGHSGGKSVVRVISRKTNANFDFRLPRQYVQGAREFNRLVEMFANTEQKNGQRNSLRRVLVETFEVINGRSGVKMSLVSNENEVIVGSGPLLGSTGGGVVTNVEFGRDQHLDDLVDYENGRNFKAGIHDSIQDFRMIGNNGKKEIAILFTVRPGSDGREESLRVTFLRVHLGIMTATQFQQLEASASN